MSHSLRYTDAFFHDLDRHYQFLSQTNPRLGEQAYDAVVKGLSLLEDFPFIGRKVRIEDEDIIARELLIPFGSWGYVILYEIESDETISVLAIRHQREDDYH